MPTGQLDALLVAELQKKPVDAAAVRIIMEILEERDSDQPVEMNAQIQETWREYQRLIKTDTARPTRMRSGLLLRVASAILVLGLLFAIVPQEAGAKSFWDRFLHMTESIFEFFDPSDSNDHRVEYEFVTDHPGLQQVYEAVAELGVTEPVVPTWLPEGYELVELKVENTPTVVRMYAGFASSCADIVYKLDLYNSLVTHDYFKDATFYETQEHGGVTHYVMCNNERWVAIWVRDNVECSLSIECQEETLDEILRSIYIMEEE